MPGQTQRTISANSQPALESVAFQHMGADLQAAGSGGRRVSGPRYDGWVTGGVGQRCDAAAPDAEGRAGGAAAYPFDGRALRYAGIRKREKSGEGCRAAVTTGYSENRAQRLHTRFLQKVSAF